MAQEQEQEQTVLQKLTSVVLFVPFIVLLPIVIAILVGRLVYGVSLTVLVCVFWCTRGVDTLLVYSESPNWHDYIVDSILPGEHVTRTNKLTNRRGLVISSETKKRSFVLEAIAHAVIVA